jgi:hypothetical protein
MFSIKKYLSRGILIASLGVFFVQCTSENSSNQSEDPIEEEVNVDNGSNIMNFDGQLFSVPSPIQTAHLIKSTGSEYNSNLINSVDNINQYNSTFKQALNLGVYGADFAYASYYGQDETSIKYMRNLKKLLDELDLSSVVDEDFVDRIGDNLENQDSLMTISSDMFRKADNYLKGSDQSDVAGLILTGGFVESLYFSANLAKMDASGDLAKRVGEQKQTVSNIVLLLSKNEDKQAQELSKEFADLESIFENVQVDYQYARPETDPNKKVTIIKSTTQINVSDEVLEEILVKITSIRTLITG